MADKRITELTNEKLVLGDGDYTIVDSNEGTYKYKLKRIVDSIPAPDTTLSIAGRAADAAKTGEELTGVKEDLGAITDVDVVAHNTYKLTGTSAAAWATDVPIVLSSGMYINLLSATNNTTVNRKMWVRVQYTDDTLTDTFVFNVREWYPINFDPSKTLRQVFIQFVRSDSALDESTTSEWEYLVVRGEPLGLVINEINSEINIIEEVTGKVYTTSFETSGSHSSTNDTINQNISKDSSVDLLVSFESSEEIALTWVVTYSDLSTENVDGRSGTAKTIQLTNDVVKIGVYFGALTSTTTATIAVKVLGEFDLLKNEIHPKYGDVYSVNADGISRTYIQSISEKKLYIPNGEQTGPSVNQQGAAYEDGKVIIATHEHDTTGSNCTLDIWDYETAIRLYSFPVANDAIGHGNNICATGIKIDESDLCSLLIISDSATAGSLYVCRVTTSGVTVLHKIEFAVSDVGYYANYLYNDQNETIVSIGYTLENIAQPTNNPMIVCVWDIADWNNPNVTPVATMRYKYTLPYMDIYNGGIIRNGIIYVMCTPFQFTDYTYIAISPIETKSITNRWHLNVKTEYENINFIDDYTIIYGAYWFYKKRIDFVN